MNPTVIILAAGLGTRMKSGLAKALHPLAGTPMVVHVLEAAGGLRPEKIVLVLGHQADRVRQVVEGRGAEVVLQAEQLGTGHAVMQASEAIGTASGPIIILCADTPLISTATLRALLETHGRARAAVTLVTTAVDDPSGYGRIVRGKAGVTRVVEERDASAAQKRITEVNAGIYCFEKGFLLSVLGTLENRNAQKEYYLPDAVAFARKKKLRVAALLCKDPREVMGVNSRSDLSRAETVLRARTNHRWMRDGVTILDPQTVFISPAAVIGSDTTLYPNVRIEGKTAVGPGCIIYPGARIVDSTLAEGVTVKDCCVIEGSRIAAGASVGPFAHLRPGAELAEGARIGNFVEVKKSTIGRGSKANHLAYIGDATVGNNVNIGAGVITCNYDGFQKHRTVIEDDVFIGSDAQLVAPVKIGKGALVAAGATITQDVPPDALAISRAPQVVKEGVAARRRRMRQGKSTKSQAANDK